MRFKAILRHLLPPSAFLIPPSPVHGVDITWNCGLGLPIEGDCKLFARLKEEKP